jgi:hypothetical protein
MADLVEWLREVFEERGKKVDVRLVESTNEGLRWGKRIEHGVGDSV